MDEGRKALLDGLEYMERAVAPGLGDLWEALLPAMCADGVIGYDDGYSQEEMFRYLHDVVMWDGEEIRANDDDREDDDRLIAALLGVVVRDHPDSCWKSRCGDKSFIVYVDTPIGMYSRMFDDDRWCWFDCAEDDERQVKFASLFEDDVKLLASVPAVEKTEDGGFNLHWRNGDRVKMGDEFTYLGLGRKDGESYRLTGVSIQEDGKCFAYCGDTGYPLLACEPKSKIGLRTCYDRNGKAGEEFVCSECGVRHKSDDVKQIRYCPGCGRIVM